MVLMSNRILISLILTLFAGTAVGESGESGTTNSNPTIQLGNGDWLLYRPQQREAEVFDFDYFMSHLRSYHAGVGLRFIGSDRFTLDLTMPPLTDYNDYIGPVYDMDIGATRLTVSISF